jgi:lipoyl synthase
MEQTIPLWVKKKVRVGEEYEKVRQMMRRLSINTVCESAVCPNMYECFGKRYVSFMILGDRCTRVCRFCGVSQLHKTEPPDEKEPENIAVAIKELGMRYAVITSPSRDDLTDGGAKQYARTTEEIRNISSGTKIELLIPDFKGDIKSLETVFASKPDVISHNIDTVPSLYPSIRPLSSYETSMNVLKMTKENGFITKSGIMLGLGEKKEEVIKLLYEIRDTGCEYLVIGQYLRPSKKAIPVVEFLHEDIFKEYEETGKNLGFKNVFAGTFYRSSYMAERLILP